jgi:hypothetical protein
MSYPNAMVIKKTQTRTFHEANQMLCSLSRVFHPMQSIDPLYTYRFYSRLLMVYFAKENIATLCPHNFAND